MDNKDKIIQEQREEICLLNEEIKRLQLLSSRKRSLRSTPSISILFSKDGKMYTVKEQESRILRPGKQDIIRNAGITGSRVFVRNMKKRK